MSLGVTIFLLSSCKNKVLLIKRRDVPVFTLPGGGIDSGETCEQAAIREMKEETGLDVQVKRIIGYYYPINKLAKPTILIECESIGGVMCTSDETSAVEFFDLDKLPYRLPEPYPEWIADGLKNEPVYFKAISSATYKKLFFYLSKHPILIFRFLASRLNLPINT